jgi:hypothetical protein
MGEVAELVSQYVSAYSTDLRDESLDGQRVVVAGIVTGRRTVITKAKAAMAIVTIEDLQGSIEIVVFPRLFEQTGPTWRDGAILLVAGRVDHKGDDISLLADLVSDWDDASAAGPDAFKRQVAATDRGASRRTPAGGNGSGFAGRTGYPPPMAPQVTGTAPSPGSSRPLVEVRPGSATTPGSGPTTTPAMPYVSPRRGGGTVPVGLPAIAPAEPIGAHVAMSRRSRMRLVSGSLRTRRPTPRSTPDRAPSFMSTLRGSG